MHNWLSTPQNTLTSLRTHAWLYQSSMRFLHRTPLDCGLVAMHRHLGAKSLTCSHIIISHSYGTYCCETESHT